MRKSLLIMTIAAFLLAFLAKDASAINDPRETTNNVFGIHIMNEGDLDDAETLVNSSDGEWGYVTVVIRKDERNIDRWQRFFDTMRRKKLIPIVRIATRQTPDGWEKFDRSDINNWVYFLNSLNWVIENRYLIIGNEPNHASEWGGEVNPEEYADYLYEITSALKQASEDFFIMPAGMDASAPNGKDYMTEEDFLSRMHSRHPDIFDRMDGWASHSYPNPGFSGSASDTGKGTIKTYEWEMELLSSFGVNKDLPIFITETGWVHDMDSEIMGLNSISYVTSNYTLAFEQAWRDESIVAITPFVLNYQDPPFDIFSWKNRDGDYYDFYYDLQKIKKIKGSPIQKTAAAIRTVFLPEDFHRSDKIVGYAVVENTGQDIWEESQISITNDGDDLNFQSSINTDTLEPGQKEIVFFNLDLPTDRLEEKQLILKVSKDSFPISQSFRINFPSTVEGVSTQDLIPDKPKYNVVRTVLPVILFQEGNDDIVTSI